MCSILFFFFFILLFFFFQAEDGIRDIGVTGVQTCALPISLVRILVPVRFGYFVVALSCPVSVVDPLVRTFARLVIIQKATAAI